MIYIIRYKMFGNRTFGSTTNYTSELQHYQFFRKTVIAWGGRSQMHGPRRTSYLGVG